MRRGVFPLWFLLLGVLLLGIIAGCSSPQYSGPDHVGEASRPIREPASTGTEQGMSAASQVLGDDSGQTTTHLLLVEGEGMGLHLQARPVDPVSLADLPGHGALDFGHHYLHTFSPDGRKLAVIAWPSGWDNRGGALHLIDVPSWTDTKTDVTFDSYVTALAFGLDGETLYWLGPTGTDPAHGAPRDYELYRYNPGTLKSTLVTRFPSSFFPWEMRLLRSGNRMVVYGTPADASFLAEDLPHVFIVDLTTGRIVSDVRLEGVVAGQVREETAAEDEYSYKIYKPGLAWDLDRDRLYVVHAAANRVTVIDLARGEVLKQEDISPRLSLRERVERWLFPVARAKLVPETTRWAVLSGDGTRLYVVGKREEMIREPGRSRWRVTPLGLQVIATGNLSELRRLDLPVNEVALSFDGRRLLLAGAYFEAVFNSGVEVHEGYGLYVFDSERIQQLTHLLPGAEVTLHGFSHDGRYAYVSHTTARGGGDEERMTLQTLDLASQRFVALREFERQRLYQLLRVPVHRRGAN